MTLAGHTEPVLSGEYLCKQVPRKRGRKTTKKKRHTKEAYHVVLLGSILTAVIICAVRGLLWLIGFVIMFPFAVIKQIIRIMGGRQ